MRDTLIIVLLLIAVAAFYYYDHGEEEHASSVGTVLENDSVTAEVDDGSHIGEESSAPNRTLPSSLEASKNLLINGGFEGNLRGWDYQAGIYWSDNGGQGGSAGLLLNPPSIERGESRAIYAKAATQCVNINGTSTYAAEASFRYLDKLPARPSVNRAHMYWYFGRNCSGGGQYAGYLEPNLEPRSWQRVVDRKLVPSLGAKSWQIRLEQRQDGNNDAEAIWDDVVFVELGRSDGVTDLQSGTEELTLAMGENYVKNPGFNEDTRHWQPSRSKRLKWRPSSGLISGGAIAATLPNDRGSSMGTGSFGQCVNFGTERRFELGAKVKIDPASTIKGGGRLRPTWYEKPDCKGRNKTSTSHADVDKSAIDWQNLHVEDLSPATGSKSVRISVIHSIEGRGSHTMLWDDFYFRAY